MHADVAQSGSSQDRIGDGVGKNIGIGVAFQTQFRRNGDASQDERAAGSQPVNIPAQAGSDFAQERTSPAICSWKKRRARSISLGLVILMLRSLPSTTLTSTSRRSTRLASSVPVNPSLAADSNACISRSYRKT